jgi:maltooligosyltrehalose trehalohydrolase
MNGDDVPLGASPRNDGRCSFLVWAPRAGRVEVDLQSAAPRRFPLERCDRGYHHREEPALPGDLYTLSLDGGPPRPDPASRLQPRGVHGPSVVVDSSFRWSDGAWKGLPLERYVFYELHVGTFSPEGTFDAVISRLAGLADLGVTALELMPVAQFPGSRNWGYDGVAPFAVQNSYGGHRGLKRLVDACHRAGMAAVLDVVYNHLGPEGNYLEEFGPYFTDRYRTPWGDAVNFDDRGSDGVRRFFLENARRWITEFHFDALRIDAVHAIRDHSACPFLGELTEALEAEGNRLGRPVHVIGESDWNDARLVRRRREGGLALDAQWSDDFHHSLHALLTGERNGYYQDFGTVGHLATAYEQGFVYQGQRSAYRGRRHGSTTKGVPGKRFIVSAQNHDQIGNRSQGDRLSALVDFESLKVAAAAVLLSPYLPLLFMGEEYGETAPFLYFVSHEDPQLVESVRRGRREKFAAFGWQNEAPDPLAESTFIASRLNPGLAASGRHRALYEFCRELLRLRREVPALASLDRARVEAHPFEAERTLAVERRHGDSAALLLLAFTSGVESIRVRAQGRWRKALDSAEDRWAGTGHLAPLRLERSTPEAPITLAGPAALLYLSEPDSGTRMAHYARGRRSWG